MSRARGLAAALVLLAGVASGACAAEATPKRNPEACFIVRDVDGFSAPNEHTVYIRVGVRDVYRLDLMTDCLDLTFRETIGLETRPANPWICSPLEAEVVYHDRALNERCPVSAITKLTPEQAEALPKRDRP